MILDTDTMSANERFTKVINHEEPDRLPIYIMGIPDYSKVFIEIMADDERVLDEWTENDDNILFTPLGDMTIRYNLGAELEHKSIGIIADFTSKQINKEGVITGDSSPTKKTRAMAELRKKQKKKLSRG